MTDAQALRLKLLSEYIRKHGWEKLRALDRKRYKGVSLARWVYDQRTRRRKGLLSKEMIKALESIKGWTWGNYKRTPSERLDFLKQYATKHDLAKVKERDSYRGFKIGIYINYLRTQYQRGTLDAKTIRHVERLKGWSWAPLQDRHLQTLKVLKQFVSTHGWEKLKTTTRYRGVNIGTWVASRRSNYRDGKLPEYLREALQSLIGWQW